jgi:hypothetical protein
LHRNGKRGIKAGKGVYHHVLLREMKNFIDRAHSETYYLIFVLNMSYREQPKVTCRTW